MARIYLSPPHMGSLERRLLLEAFDSNWIAPLGPQVEAFEREAARRTEVGHALALSSGTAALHLALVVLGVASGDEVLTSSLTFAATANAITYVGARPFFIDSEPRHWCMDPDLLEAELRSRAACGRRPRAVISVDIYGQCSDYSAILPLCEEFQVPLIEDAAEALGASHAGRPAGSFGEMGAFSFNGNKIITTSGGGMLVSNRADYLARARHLSTQARDPAVHYQHSAIGYNYRLSNLLAAVGRGQLAHLDERIEARRAINAAYRRRLEGCPGIEFMAENPRGHSTFWLTCITVDPERFGASREDIRLHLETSDIESRPVWKPMHLQPVFSACPTRGGRVSADLFERGLCLPSGSAMSEEQVDWIAEEILSTPRQTKGQ